VNRKRSSWIGGAADIWHYVKFPSKAARLLIAKHGAAVVRKHALQELRNARPHHGLGASAIRRTE
jgi:hypothetical protein